MHLKERKAIFLVSFVQCGRYVSWHVVENSKQNLALLDHHNITDGKNARSKIACRVFSILMEALPLFSIDGNSESVNKLCGYMSSKGLKNPQSKGPS